MLALIQQYDVAKRLEKVVALVKRDNPGASAGTLQAATQTAMRDIKSLFVSHVIDMTDPSLGVREQKLPHTVKLPRGIYALVPTKMTDSDGATPTHINVRAVGIQSNSPNARFTNTHVPAMQTAVERAVGELGF